MQYVYYVMKIDCLLWTIFSENCKTRPIWRRAYSIKQNVKQSFLTNLRKFEVIWTKTTFWENGQKRSFLHSFHDVISLLKSVTMMVTYIRFKWGFLQMIKGNTRYSDIRKLKIPKFFTSRVEAPLKYNICSPFDKSVLTSCSLIDL